jgi:hypothetical protein
MIIPKLVEMLKGGVLGQNNVYRYISTKQLFRSVDHLLLCSPIDWLASTDQMTCDISEIICGHRISMP